jgi:hypothetical protein
MNEKLTLFDYEGFLPDDQQENLDDERGSLDTSDVVLYSTDWTVESVINQVHKKRINLNPSFQRRQAWSVSHRSKFIESLMLNIPIPQIVLAEDPNSKGHYIVIDGKQRLLSLVQYVQSKDQNQINEVKYNTYKLKGLSKGIDETEIYNGKKFFELPSSVQAQIENTVLRTVIIRSVKNEKFLYEAFLRLNQGSKSLSPQELRQALAPGYFIDWLDDYVCASESLQKALRIDSPDPRMRDTEVALRFMAYSEALNGYDGKFRQFLDNYLLEKNKQYQAEISNKPDVAEKLERAIETTISIFEDNAFEKFDPKTEQFGRKFNRAVFDSMTFFFSDAKVSKEALEKKDAIISAFKNLCLSSPDYVSSVESSFKDVKQTYSRLRLWGDQLSQILEARIPLVEIENNRIVIKE